MFNENLYIVYDPKVYSRSDLIAKLNSLETLGKETDNDVFLTRGEEYMKHRIMHSNSNCLLSIMSELYDDRNGAKSFYEVDNSARKAFISLIRDGRLEIYKDAVFSESMTLGEFKENFEPGHPNLKEFFCLTWVKRN